MDDRPATHAIEGRTLSRGDLAAMPGQPRRLADCNLDEADLSGLDMTGWFFERCSFRQANLQRATLIDTVWTSCRGAFADFAGADASDARITASDFNNAIFRRSILASAHITGSKLTGADFSEARVLDLTLEEVLLINAKLVGFSFRKQTLDRIDFSQADLRKCDFRATTFNGCSLRDAVLTGSRFDGADLRGADIGGLRLTDASLFKGATISADQAGQLLSELGLKVR